MRKGSIIDKGKEVCMCLQGDRDKVIKGLVCHTEKSFSGRWELLKRFSTRNGQGFGFQSPARYMVMNMLLEPA